MMATEPGRASASVKARARQPEETERLQLWRKRRARPHVARQGERIGEVVATRAAAPSSATT